MSVRKRFLEDVHTGSEVSVWSTGLNLGDILLPKSKLLIKSEYILSDRQRGHSVGIMRNTTEAVCALSGGEGFPPLGTPDLGVQGSPDHHVCGALYAVTL